MLRSGERVLEDGLQIGARPDAQAARPHHGVKARLQRRVDPHVELDALGDSTTPSLLMKGVEPGHVVRLAELLGAKWD